MNALSAAFEQPSPDDRTLAMLALLLMAFSGMIGPLVIFCVKQDSRFVRFHALQALIWQAAYIVLVMLSVSVFTVAMVASLIHNPPALHGNAPPPAFVFFFPFIWIGTMGGWIVNLILGIVYAIKAQRGEWATFPVFGKWLLPQPTPTE